MNITCFVNVKIVANVRLISTLLAQKKSETCKVKYISSYLVILYLDPGI